MSPRPLRRAALELFDLGIDPASLPADVMRRIRIIAFATLALCVIAAGSIPAYWALGLPEVCLALALAMLAGLANLVLLRRTRRPVPCGHLALALLAAELAVSNLATGGFRDPAFSWFYVLPLAAAVAVDARGAWIWLGVTLLAVLAFWGLDAAGLALPSRIPEALRGRHALFERVTAVLGLGLIAASFVAGQRRVERGLARANRELRRETAYVQLLEHAAVAANEAASLDEAMWEGAKRICATMGWAASHIYVVGEDGVLRTSRLIHTDDDAHFAALRQRTLVTTIRAGEGLPGRALASGRTQAQHDIGSNPDGPRGALALRLGLRTAFALPVLVGGRVAAVLEFATREPLEPNPRLLEVLGHVGVQIGRVGERAALHERLRQSQKLEAVGRLAAGVAHEINNPMAYVRSNLNQLRGEWHALRAQLEKLGAEAPLADRFDECEELIGESLEGVERTVAIVRDMKELSRAGASPRDPADLREVVEGALRMASSRAPEGVRLEARCDPGLPPVPCDPNQLHQVVLNLVVNALEAVGERGRVRVETGRDARCAWVRVEDDGPGLAPGARERLFDPFFTTKAAGEGTGLGLAISYEIARAHGGEIRVHSRPGAGTRMELRLPLAPEPAAA